MSADLKYIIVDDDEFNNVLHDLIIKDALGEVDIQAFTHPEEGLEFIQEKYKKGSQPTILFLDINMPTLNGWQFLEKYKNFTEKIKKQISIYMLSSSLDQRDKERAEANEYVKGFISKPLDFETITAIAEA